MSPSPESSRGPDASQGRFPDMTELLSESRPDTPEIKSDEPPWETEIIFQRHAQYDSGWPEKGWPNPSDTEKDTLGHLTVEGVLAAETAADARIDEAIKTDGDKVDFLVIASNTHWLGHPELGQRAVETGEVISERILAKLEAAGLSEDQLYLPDEPEMVYPVRDTPELGEAKMFDSHQEFVSQLRQKYSGQGRQFWDAFFADVDKEDRLAAGAEGPKDIAARASRLINLVSEYANAYHTDNPDRKLVVFVVSHHEVLEPYAQQILGVPPTDFQPTYNDAITIKIDSSGAGHARVNDKDYQVPLELADDSEADR